MTLMMKEQLEGISALKESDKNTEYIQKIVSRCKQRNIKNVVLIARGTSNNAALYFKYYLESITPMRATKFLHSTNTILNNHQDMTDTLCLAISQSGASVDTVVAAKAAKESGAILVAVTNFQDSALSKISDYTLLLNCTEEKSVAATKTFTAEIAILSMLADAFAEKDAADYNKIAEKLNTFVKNTYDTIEKAAIKNLHINNLFVLSRGYTQFIAEEMSLKLMETGYRMAKAYSTAEFVHGPLALADENRTVILLAPSDAFKEDFIATAKKLHSLKVNLIIFSDNLDLEPLSSTFIKMPGLDKSTPYYYILAIQAFACYLAVNSGLNPDVPRNLNKVTITK